MNPIEIWFGGPGRTKLETADQLTGLRYDWRQLVELLPQMFTPELLAAVLPWQFAIVLPAIDQLRDGGGHKGGEFIQFNLIIHQGRASAPFRTIQIEFFACAACQMKDHIWRQASDMLSKTITAIEHEADQLKSAASAVRSLAGDIGDKESQPT
ncbi:MAG: hypothetical protein RB292_01705 [Patescibacteria group bacterium]|jgi:hypothetical protein|nr:hypothetical protein [Patescibacteria group bacterium]